MAECGTYGRPILGCDIDNLYVSKCYNISYNVCTNMMAVVIIMVMADMA